MFTQTQRQAFCDMRENIEDVLFRTVGKKILYANWIETILGPMLIIGDDHALYLLDFIDRKNLIDYTHQLEAKIRIGNTPILEQITSEITDYFKGELKAFQTPLAESGTEFQKKTWEVLRTIPIGETLSYKQLAKKSRQFKCFPRCRKCQWAQ